MSGLLASVETAVLEAARAWGTSSALGVDEQAVVVGILKLVSTPSILNAVPLIEDILLVIATLKAQIPPGAPLPNEGSTVINHQAAAS